MIGQKNLLADIQNMIEQGSFPRFTILVGPAGSGKKILANIVANQIKNAIVFDVGLSVSDVRSAVENSYKMINTVVRIIPDADTMSNAAKNALLKVTEEPPNNAYWIMTLEDEHNTLETIRSRGTVFYMDRYTSDEIYQYAKEYTNYTLHDDEWDIIKDICDTPGDVNIIGKYPREFYDYVELVVDNISRVSLANAFKIPSKVALKEDAEGYDLKLFWKAFIKICLDRADKIEWVIITSKYLQKLRVKGINKQMLMDNWVMEVYNA